MIFGGSLGVVWRCCSGFGGALVMSGSKDSGTCPSVLL